MNKGAGGIQRTNKVDTAPAPPPATVTGVNNGLTLAGTIAQLGGANPLLHNTTISLAGFDLLISSPVLDYLFFDQPGNVAKLGDPIRSASSMVLNMSTGISFLGDSSSFSNGTQLKIDDTQQRATILWNGGSMMILDGLSGLYEIGDIGGAGNSSFFRIDDANQQFLAGSSLGQALFLDQIGQTYAIGDIGAFGNSSTIDIDDNTGVTTVSLKAGGNAGTVLIVDDQNTDIYASSGGSVTGFLLDYSNNTYQLGDWAVTGQGTMIRIDNSAADITIGDPTNANSGTLIDVDVNGSLIKMQTTGAGSRGFIVDFTNFIYKFGDIDSVNVGTQMEIDAVLGTVIFSQANVKTNSFGVGGFPTGSNTAIIGLAAFANNAAAVLGGLAVGDLYRISLAGTSTVAVVQ